MQQSQAQILRTIRIRRLTETKVAGKKVIVTTAIAFIAEASFFASSPILT